MENGFLLNFLFPCSMSLQAPHEHPNNHCPLDIFLDQRTPSSPPRIPFGSHRVGRMFPSRELKFNRRHSLAVYLVSYASQVLGCPLAESCLCQASRQCQKVGLALRRSRHMGSESCLMIPKWLPLADRFLAPELGVSSCFSHFLH